MKDKLFGTDGIRGKANTYPMTADMALKIGQAVAKYFKKKVDHDKKTRILIGKDTRVSGYLIEYALTSGICSQGVDVLLVGPMPTPAIAHLTKSFAADAGIVISASHNPFDDNGIKFFDKKGFKLNDDTEDEIETLALNNNFSTSEFSGKKIGKVVRIDDAQGRYIEFAKSSIRNHSLKGLKIVLDCANGAAYKIAPLIFKELGAEVITLNNNPDGININENCGATHPEIIQKEVIKHDADVGIALDGDADRVILSDEKGNLLDGDKIIAIAATYLKKKEKLKNDLVITTVQSNLGLRNYLKTIGVNTIATPVGDRYVMETMKEKKSILGGEDSGHVIFSRYTTTGDGTISALQIMDIIKKEEKKLSEYKDIYSLYPHILKNLSVKEKIPLESWEEMQKLIREHEKQLSNNGRVLIRYSGTQNLIRVLVEGKDKKQVEKIVESFCNFIRSRIGE